MKKWLLLAILLFPMLAFGSSQGSVFSVDPTDKSMQYLGIALGTIPGSPIVAPENAIKVNGIPIIESMFYVFNQVIFGLGVLVVAYASIIGTITTAQEGEFLGRQKWHPILVPLRAACGIFLLLPSATGYNWIQMAVIWFIVQGVGAANALWKQVIYFNQSQGSIRTDTREMNLMLVGNTVNAIFNADLCMIAMNSDPNASNLLGGPVSVYTSNDSLVWGIQSKNQPVCGSVTVPNVSGGLFSSSDQNSASRTETLMNSLMMAQLILYPAAMEAYGTTGTTNLGTSSFVTAANLLNGAVQGLTATFDTMTEINKQAIEDGWILAGSYYFQIVQGSGKSISVHFSTTGPNSDYLNSTLGSSLASQLITTINASSSDYTSSVSDTLETDTTPTQLSLVSQGGNANVTSLFAALFGSLMEGIVKSLEKQMTQGAGGGDPLISMASFGAWLTTTCEIIFWSVLATYFFIWVTSAVFQCVLPLGPSINMLLSIFIPIAIFIISMFYAAGIVLALYIPLIPYLVFTFTAFGWMVLVIEALLGASLIGLSLVIPSEDELGKSVHAVMILLGLFLRPVLMILGFVLAIQLLMVAFTMLNFGFWKTLISYTGASSGVGAFGMIAVLTMYAGIATTLTHEAFSLIYVLPNKVIRWIGGSGEEDVAGQKTKELKGSVEKGGQIATGAMKGVLGHVGGKVGSKK